MVMPYVPYLEHTSKLYKTQIFHTPLRTTSILNSVHNQNTKKKK